MPQIITISGVTGGVPPLSFYICDENGNNCSYLSNSGGTFTASTYYSTATTLMIKVIDSNGCEFFKIINCPFDTFIILTEDEFGIQTEDGFILVWI